MNDDDVTLEQLLTQVKQQKNQITHLKRDLKKARFRIEKLKAQKNKLIKKNQESSGKKTQVNMKFFHRKSTSSSS